MCITTNLSLNKNIIPVEHKLFENYPNPFNTLATINYYLANDEYLTVEVADLKGKHVKTLMDSSFILKGARSLLWNAKNKNGKTVLTSLYFYTFGQMNFFKQKKMLMLK